VQWQVRACQSLEGRPRSGKQEGVPQRATVQQTLGGLLVRLLDEAVDARYAELQWLARHDPSVVRIGAVGLGPDQHEPAQAIRVIGNASVAALADEDARGSQDGALVLADHDAGAPEQMADVGMNEIGVVVALVEMDKPLDDCAPPAAPR
jgi:hypothetical protein